MFDVIVVGAGPAGLSAALLLGRCRRRVLVCDGGPPRNAAAAAVHGFLSRDGVAPQELLRLAQDQLQAYPDVERRAAVVRNVTPADGRFTVTLDGGREACRRVLLATGVVDQIPPVAGARELFGRGVYHCPYCDGWEVRDTPLAVYGRGQSGAQLAEKLLRWSGDVVLCSDGPDGLSQAQRERLAGLGVAVRREAIARLEGKGGRLARIAFADGTALPRRALFFANGQHQGSPLAEQVLGRGERRHRGEQATKVPGLYLAGDACRDVQLVIAAAADGARAALAIHQDLHAEDLEQRLRAASARAGNGQPRGRGSAGAFAAKKR